MYLKSIEIQGFKSFAQKIRFEFHNGITGIVGPNGSGKSNVADAVRWVLGEQKVKQLRSSNMQDVIFAGTENRKAQSYAYVALTLDNSDHKLPLDYNEITVARRIFRSGESEYLLNGRTCRRRDIQELFYDTGIGKEGYSIIGQGQIDKILSGRPEDRRELFDEAAGIVKFKRRKSAAQKKLESEEANLVRVNDILSELERQIGPLEKQSEAAKIYLNKRDVLKNLDVNLFLQEDGRLEKQTEELADKLSVAESQRDDARHEYARIGTEYQKSRDASAQIEADMDQLREQISRMEMDRQKHTGDIQILEEQIRGIQNDELHYNTRLQAINSEVEEKTRLREQYEAEQADQNKALEELQHDKYLLDKQNRELTASIKKIESDLESSRQQVINRLNKKAEIQADIKRLETLYEQTQIHISSLHADLLREQDGEGDFSETVRIKEEAFRDVSDQIKDLENQRNGIIKKREDWRNKLEAARKEFEVNMENFHKLTSRLESLKNIAERYDGYGNSIRRVMEQKSSVPGLIGVVADLIQVDKRYETAIETALGGSIQNIVTEDEKTAKKMIAYLKEHKYGRATFLPLTSITASRNKAAREALSDQGALGMADELVTTDPKYASVASHLLGRTLVVDEIDHALTIARKHRFSIRIVTLAGELLQPGGAISGGAYKNNSALLGRNREIDELQKKIKEVKDAAKSKRNRMDEIRTASDLLKDELSELNLLLQETYIQQNTAKIQLEQAKRDRDAKEQAFLHINTEIRRLQDELTGITASQEEHHNALDELSKMEQDLDESMQAAQVLLEETQDARAKLDEEMSALAVKETALSEKVIFIGENIQRIYVELKQLSDETNEIQNSRSNSEDDIRQKKAQILKMQEEIRDFSVHSEENRQKLQDASKEKELIAAQSQDHIRIREELNQVINETDKEVYRLGVQKEKTETELKTLRDYMWEEYELTLHNAESLRDETLPGVTELKKQISALRSEIRALGPVNVNAIEEYKSVSERFHFMDAQRNDLEDARKTLVNIIEDLDEGMRRQFREKFKDIQKEFNHVFRELFGGGQGTLELAEGDDILEQGILIIAQPPGKKLQNMMQLSGGEKALTAISLLFAIQNLKPSPFCLLDEIEAALDDSNVGRYASYLHKLTKNTQFIVITHRRGTMTAADRLYGITMQEKGVSALVSVNLIEDKLDE
jgi:chromosome segregation protein